MAVVPDHDMYTEFFIDFSISVLFLQAKLQLVNYSTLVTIVPKY